MIINYAFDDIGKRKCGSSGAFRVQTYMANLLNQCTNRNVHDFVESSGKCDGERYKSHVGTAISSGVK